MPIIPEDDSVFSPEEHALIAVKRRELQAMLRFISRNYIYLVCHGRMNEAAELLHAYRGLGALDFGTAFACLGGTGKAEPENGAPSDPM